MTDQKELRKRQFGDDSDDSEDEQILSRIGEVPHEWYRKEEHFGYQANGKPVEKAEQNTGIKL